MTRFSCRMTGETMEKVARVYLDLETTGLDPERHSVIEVGAFAVDTAGDEVSNFQAICNPGELAMRNSEPKAFKVNGIDPQDVLRAPPIEVVAECFMDWLDKSAELYAFPVAFESRFLVKKPWSIDKGRWAPCVMAAVRSIMGAAGALQMIHGKPKRPKLVEAAAFFGVTVERSHRALDDARTTAKIHKEVLVYQQDPLMDEAEKLKDGM